MDAMRGAVFTWTTTVCECCGAEQPMQNGIGRGQCKVCFHGYLRGWSQRGRETCGYAGCNERAIAAAPRVGQCCAGHYERAHRKPRPNNQGPEETAQCQP